PGPLAQLVRQAEGPLAGGDDGVGVAVARVALAGRPAGPVVDPPAVGAEELLHRLARAEQVAVRRPLEEGPGHRLGPGTDEDDPLVAQPGGLVSSGADRPALAQLDPPAPDALHLPGLVEVAGADPHGLAGPAAGPHLELDEGPEHAVAEGQRRSHDRLR